jgi:uncharacterized membrane protein
MSENAGSYISLTDRTRFRRQATKVWCIAIAVVACWVLAIVAPPLLASNGANAQAAPFYRFFSFICHQIPERSFHILEHQLAVCSRCFGVYFGLLTGLVAYPLIRGVDDIEPLPRIWLFASMVPIAIDWSLGVFGIWENNHASRFITGLILGFTCAVYIVPALVEIVRNFGGKTASNIH